MSERKWQVWSEGYRATGNQSGAIFHGEWNGSDFTEAARNWAKSTGEPNHFDEGRLTYWACRLFDNERDARRSFG